MVKKIIKKKLVEEGFKVEEPKTDNPILLERLEALEKKEEASQKELTMLRAVADKGRMFNYENKTVSKKAMNINLSVYNGKYIVGWRTLKDVLVKNPTTGLTVGEEQKYELLLLGEDESIEKVEIDSYSRFSEIRYSERVQAKVVGKKEDEDGNFTFSVQLSDERIIQLDQRFIN